MFPQICSHYPKDQRFHATIQKHIRFGSKFQKKTFNHLFLKIESI